MAQQEDGKVVYPPGVKELTNDISTDELYRRLKMCIKVLQTLNQEDENSMYMPLAYHLASDFFLEHKSRDIRRGAALCIADIFRIFAPCNPYGDLKNLQAVFQLIIDQLKGLTQNGGTTNFTDSFYLLENLTVMKTFNLCHDLQKPEEIIVPLFKQMFSIVSSVSNLKVRRLTFNMLSPIIAEGDSIPTELLEFLLKQLIEPNKSKFTVVYSLTQDLIKQTASALEPFIQATFIHVMSEQVESFVSDHLYELIYELNLIIPTEMIVIVNNLETKLLSSCEDERIEVITLLSKLFSGESKMIEQNKNLWNSYISRYKDASTKVRCLHMKYSKDLLLSHPQVSKPALIECFLFNITDPDEKVRKQTCLTISESISKLYDILDPQLWERFKERSLDKNYDIREAVLVCFGKLYHQWVEKKTPPVIYDTDFKLEWIRNKIFYRYYGENVQDKTLVEKLFIKYMAPYTKPAEERMKFFYQLYCTIDEHAHKAFTEMMKTRNLIRIHVNKLVRVLDCDSTEIKQRTISKILPILSVFFKDPTRGNGIITAFSKHLEDNSKLREIFASILSPTVPCATAAQKYKEIVSELHNDKFLFYIAQVAARILPIVDKECVKNLISIVDNSFQGDCVIEADLGLQNSFLKGFELLKMLSALNSSLFQDDRIFQLLLSYLKAENDEASVPSLQILCNICNNLIENYPAINEELRPILRKFAETGKPAQAKHSVYLLNKIIPENERAEFFTGLMRSLYQNFKLEKPNFTSALVSSGHIAHHWRHLFQTGEFKDMVTYIVTSVLMDDGDFPRGGNDMWGPYENLPEQTKVKIEGMKCIVRWLTGKEKFVKPTMTTIKCFCTYIENGGDLTEHKHNSPMENSWLRLSAACRMLKLCHISDYAVALNLKQFQTLAYILNDSCPEVCDIFAKKLSRALYFFKLPLYFLAVFAVGGLNDRKDFKAQVKVYLSQNIHKRRIRLKECEATQDDYFRYLPEYALPCAIHLLAHAPFFTDHTHIPSLRKIRDCLCMFMECLISKNENYSYSFFKTLIETIKQTKDMQDPEDEIFNLKLYVVADLALNIVMSQKTYVLKDFPALPALDIKFFTDPDLNFSNMKTYLPPEFLQEKPVQSCFGIDFADVTRNQNSESSIQSTLNSTEEEPEPSEQSRSDNENTENHMEEEPKAPTTKRKRNNASKSSSNKVDDSVVETKRTRTKRTAVLQKAKSNDLSIKKTEKQRGRPPKNSPNRNQTMKKPAPVATPESILSDVESSSNSTSSYSAGVSVNISDSSSIKRLIKECNVCLNVDEIEQYKKKFPLRMNNVTPAKRKRGRPNSTVTNNLNSSISSNGSSDMDNSVDTVLNKKPSRLRQREVAVNNSNNKDVTLTRSKRAKMLSESTVEDSPKTNSSSISVSKTNSSNISTRSISSSIIRYAPRRSGAAPVIVQNSQDSSTKLQQKSKPQSNHTINSLEENNPPLNKKPVTRSNNIKSSPKSVNKVASGKTLRNKVAKENSKPSLRSRR